MNELDRETEERYLVSLLIPYTRRTLRDQALATVDAEDFGSGAYGGIWAAARRLRSRELPIDRRNLLAEVKVEAGGDRAERLLDSLEMPDPADFPQAVREVTTTGKRRRLVESLDRARQRAMSAEDYGDAVTVIEEEIAAAQDRDGEAQGVAMFGDAVDRLEQRLKSGAQEEVVTTPWPEINEMLSGGFHRGRLHVIGARPGEGKSIMAHQLAANAAAHGHPAMVFSLEMSESEVAGRLVSGGGKIELGEITRTELSDDSWQSFHEFQSRSKTWPLWIDDRPNLTVERIISTCREHKRRHGLDLLCVDYLQLLSMSDRSNREQQVNEIARRFKNLSRELDCAVVLPSQLNRDTAKRGKPSMSDLRESGGIESHADMVVLLARQYLEDGTPNGEIKADVAKNRFGRTGVVDLSWRAHYAMIGSLGTDWSSL